MSAVVCGKRSSIFEDLQSSPSTSPPVSKRIRWSSSSSPVRFSPPRSTAAAVNYSSFGSNNFDNLSSASRSSSSQLDHLIQIFPEMDKQFLERALEECGDDLDCAIRSLNELRLGSAENLVSGAGKADASQDAEGQYSTQGAITNNVGPAPTDDSSVGKDLPIDGTEWVELFVREMMNASNVDDAKARASQALEVLEKSICARATAQAAQAFQQENILLKQQLEALIQENTILKRAVSIQHERQKEFEDRGQELQQLKQLASQYQEQLRTLEVNNYALSMHLKQAQQSNNIPGRFHPDIF